MINRILYSQKAHKLLNLETKNTLRIKKMGVSIEMQAKTMLTKLMAFEEHRKKRKSYAQFDIWIFAVYIKPLLLYSWSRFSLLVNYIHYITLTRLCKITQTS